MKLTDFLRFLSQKCFFFISRCPLVHRHIMFIIWPFEVNTYIQQAELLEI